MTDREFRAVYETAAESRLWLAWSAAQRAWSAAWRESSAVRLAGRVTASLGEWPAADRVRYGAIALATAALGHVGFVALFPAYVAPAFPRAAVLAVAILAAVVASLPQQFVRAWGE